VFPVPTELTRLAKALDKAVILALSSRCEALG
jgi:hypothetical protein